MMDPAPLRAMIGRMKQLATIALCATLSAVPANAQGGDEMSEGLGLLEEGTRMLLRGLMNEMSPALENLSDDLREALGDLSSYHPPEVLPNGDILIRRKTPLERGPDDGSPGDMPEVGEDGDVEL